MKRKTGKMLGLCAFETLQSRLLLSADADSGEPEVIEGEPLEFEIMPFEIDPLEIDDGIVPTEEEWYTLELPADDGAGDEVIEDEFEIEILVIDEGEEGEIPPEDDSAVIDGEEIYYMTGGLEGEEESPISGDGVDGEVTVVSLPDAGDNPWLALGSEACQVTVIMPKVDKLPQRFRGLKLAGSDDAPAAKRPGKSSRVADFWEGSEGDAMPDDTPGSDEEPADDDDGLAIVAPDVLPDGSPFGGDVEIDEDSVLVDGEELLA